MTEQAVEINWDLLHRLSVRAHPLLNLRTDGHEHECCPWDGEVMQEARTSHHLLDMVGIPGAELRGYRANLDARTYVATRKLAALRERLARIAAQHARETGSGGLVGDLCTECDTRWPCDTRRTADGTYESETGSS